MNLLISLSVGFYLCVLFYFISLIYFQRHYRQYKAADEMRCINNWQGTAGRAQC